AAARWLIYVMRMSKGRGLCSPRPPRIILKVESIRVGVFPFAVIATRGCKGVTAPKPYRGPTQIPTCLFHPCALRRTAWRLNRLGPVFACSCAGQNAPVRLEPLLLFQTEAS